MVASGTEHRVLMSHQCTPGLGEGHMPRRKINLQLKYGIVKYRGPFQNGSRHELVFESHDAFAAMRELERLATVAGPLDNYSLIFNNHQRQTDFNAKPASSSE
jgi:hypothetical protein